jgi:tetratricopeptide (TPR) repeat protein
MHLNAIGMTRDGEGEIARRRDVLMSTRVRLPRTRSPVPIPLDRLRTLFDQATSYYRARRYRRAIIAWERIRHLPGVPRNVVDACLYNVAAANLKLQRFATALIYFETYIASPATSDRDRNKAKARLNSTMRRLSIATP